jgi:hypothetical protein
MRRKLAPLLFDDEDPAAGQEMRSSIVAPAERSASARRKASTLRTTDGFVVHSFATLLKDLSTLTKNRIQPKTLTAAFDNLTRPTALQQKALSLLAVAVSP